MTSSGAELAARLASGGVRRGSPVAVVLSSGGDLGLASASDSWVVPAAAGGIEGSTAADLVGALEVELAPRWVWWSASATAAALVHQGIRVAACWDLGTVHRLLHGGSRDDAAAIWAGVQGLDPDRAPNAPSGSADPARHGQLDLLTAELDSPDVSEADWPVRPDGQLRPSCLVEVTSPERAGRLAALAARAQALQAEQLHALATAPASVDRPGRRGDPRTTGRSESAAALLCVELSRDGLPLDRSEAERLIGAIIGPRPQDDADRQAERRRRDAIVLRHVPGHSADLRNPAQVRELLRAVGIDVADTRSWRLEPLRGVHPVVEPLLAWRKAERIETTYGYTWLDRDVGPDGRLRGGWQASDGAAGRMTAGAGLHNLPVELRGAVLAEPGHVFVRADLGQIEPRVLAAVSGDPGLLSATQDDDLYLPVAAQLGVPRPVAKIAVLAAMYGQTSGSAGQALRRMEGAYPLALSLLHAAEAAGRAGRPITTYGGRLVRVWQIAPATDQPEPAGEPTGEATGEARPAGESGPSDHALTSSAAASRGRFTRNAAIQGAAAELFKAWAAAARLELRATGAQIVLCLHDELLVHAPAASAEDSARIVADTLQSTARRWFAGSPVRFVADIRILWRWSEAKD